LPSAPRSGAAITLTSDLLNAYKAHELEQELKNAKESIAEMIKSAFKDIYDIIADDEKLLDFFAPQLKAFEKIVETVEERSRFGDCQRLGGFHLWSSG